MPETSDLQERIDALAGTALYLPCILSLVTGMRESEVLGLKWQDVNYQKQQIYVCRVRQYVSEKKLKEMVLNVSTRPVVGLKGNIERDYPKGKKNHFVSIPPELCALLKSEHKKQTLNRVKLGSAYKIYDYICVGEDGMPVSKNSLSKVLIGVCRYHDLRHVNAIQSLKAGFDVATVADRLGHTTPQTTMEFYAHALQEQEKKAASVMTSVFQIKS